MKANVLIILTIICFSAAAQTPVSSIPVYGESINLETAKKIASAAEAFAASKQWPVAIAIVDTGGNLVLLEKLDNTQVASIEVAIGKAKTANNFKRTTKVMEDVIANGGNGLRLLSIPGAFPLEGGEPIFVNGKIVGGIGVSGMQSGQDVEVLRAGLAAMK